MRTPSRFGCCFIFFLSFLLPTAHAGQVNVTIDDQEGDPTNGNHIIYEPGGEWNIGQNCTICTANPTPQSDAYLGTWMDATFFPNGTSGVSDAGQIIQASVSFVGTAVYVICILDPNQSSEMTFIIDGTTVGSFKDTLPAGSPFIFNSTVFSKTGLSNDSHTLQLQSGLAGQKSVVLLDAVIYTTDDGVNADDGPGTSTSSANSATTTSPQSETKVAHKARIGTIVGAVVGALVALLGILLLLLWRKRRRMRRRMRFSLDLASNASSPAPAPMMSTMANNGSSRAFPESTFPAPDEDFGGGANSITPYFSAPTIITTPPSMLTSDVPATMPTDASTSAFVPTNVRSSMSYTTSYEGEDSISLPAYSTIDWSGVRSETEGDAAGAEETARTAPTAPYLGGKRGLPLTAQR